ncbi:hypothetical protein [Ahrensia sp. 13_GOM-1096m]|uniref:hypothetical protein n=1 Tax=Ahrensia sp. 13_GOM-1096m TaxID=1380380 RepID=UPI00047CD7BC|nr:hypothetical protein [Ahrensia sp. 13_GOM-1096m]
MRTQEHHIENNKPRGFDPRGILISMLHAILGTSGQVWLRFGGLVSALTIIGYFVVVIGIDYLRPSHNWDTLAYLGVAARDWMGMADPALIHAFAYDTVRSAISPEQFAIFTENDAYRERMFADPQAFVSMLGMYDVKWLYIALLVALSPFVGAYDAGFFINILAATLLSASTIWWLSANKILRLGFVVPALMMIAGVASFAMSDMPDFLTLALMMSAVFALDRNRLSIGFTLLILAVATRPDALAFAGVLMCAAWVWRDKITAGAAIAFLVAVAVYVAIQSVSTHPGWWPHYWFSTYKIQNDMTGFAPAFDLKVYVVGLGWNIVRSVLEDTWLGMYTITLGVWAMMQAGGLKLNKRRTVLVGALLLGVAAKFLIFPLHDGRVHLPLLLPAIMLLMVGLRDALVLPDEKENLK